MLSTLDEAYDQEAYDQEAYDQEAYDQEAYDQEALRPGRRPMPMRPVPTAPRTSAYRPRPSTSFVTQAQLQAALARVSRQITINSNAIRTLDGRVRGISTEQGRLAAALRKETADRTKAIDGVKKDLQSTRELAALIPLIAGGGSVTIGGTTTQVRQSSLSLFAPLLLLSPDLSGGTSTNGGSSGIFGGGLTGLIAILALTGSLGR